jgi:hypothetical protein
LGSSEAQNPGRNVNMVAGTELPFGDPFLQRQNEPECALSVRNPSHIFCVGNDYRTVDLPGLPGDSMTGDSWIGVYMSFDGGESFISTLLPGFPQDTSPEGLASPLKAYQFAADPVVEAGANGLMFVGGLVADRDHGRSAVFVARYIDNNNKENGIPVKYVDARLLVERSGEEFADKPAMAVDIPRGDETAIITVPIDEDPSETVDQEISCGTAHVAFANFFGSEAAGTLRSQIQALRSTDCGETWSNPLRLDAAEPVGEVTGMDRYNQAVVLLDELVARVEEIALAADLGAGNTNALLSRLANTQADLERGNEIPAQGKLGAFINQVEAFAALDPPLLTTEQAVLLTEAANTIIQVINGLAVERGEMGIPNQGAAIAVDPRNGNVYTAWRQFGTDVLPDAIFVAHSADGGETYGPPVEAAQIAPFDQGTSEVSFRTNSFPTIAIDGDGLAYLAHALRGMGPQNDSRIVVQTSSDGTTWSSPSLVDNHPGRGHQFMPSIVFSAGMVRVLYFDAQEDISQRFEDYIDDTFLPRHTIDVRVAQAPPGAPPSFYPSVRVSRYEHIVTGPGDLDVQLAQYFPPNYPLFRQGTAAFIGDYLHLAALSMKPDGNGGWMPNLDPDPGQLVFGTWGDNRDVKEPLDGDWTNYTPPSSSQPPEFASSVECVPERTGMRNQNLYSSAIAQDIVIGAPGSPKPLADESGAVLQRAFVVYAQNVTDEDRYVRMQIANQPPGGVASFLQFELRDVLDVAIPAFSMAARTVFVTATDELASVLIDMSEVDADGLLLGDLGSVVINADPTNPRIVNPRIVNPNIVNPRIVNFEVYNPRIVNPRIVNPRIVNPRIVNPDLQDPRIVNPRIVNPNIVNPDVQDPRIVNPRIVNPRIVNSTVDEGELTDVQWDVTNDGNTMAAYTFKMLSNQEVPEEGVYLQLLVTRTFTTPAAFGCSLEEEVHQQLLVNVINPEILDPSTPGEEIANPRIVNAGLENATFFLAPGDTALITLRIWDDDPEDNVTFDPTEVAGAAVTHAVSTEEVNNGVTESTVAANLIITSTSVPPALLNGSYSETLTAIGGEEPYIWSVASGNLPPGIQLDGATGELWGSATAEGTFDFTVQLTDSADPANTDEQALTLVVSTGAIGFTETKVSEAGGTDGDHLGISVALDGDFAIAGATGIPGPASGQGKAVIFYRGMGTFEEMTTLQAPVPEPRAAFGASVGIAQITGQSAMVVVGAPYQTASDNSNAGAVHVFPDVGSPTPQHQQLDSPDSHMDENYGQAVAISGPLLAVGAPSNEEFGAGAGAIYVYLWTGTLFAEEGKLTPVGLEAGDHFGHSVSVWSSGDPSEIGSLIAVGAPDDDDQGEDAGAAYIFRNVDGSWTQVAKLVGNPDGDGDRFGNSVSIRNNTVLIGAPYDDDGGDNTGSVFMFEFSGSSWDKTGQFAGVGPWDELGRSASLDGYALAGRPLGGRGYAEVYRRVSGTWLGETTLQGSDTAIGDDFGIAVAMSGNTAMVSAPYDDDRGTDSGSIYFFDLGVRPLYIDTTLLLDGTVDEPYTALLEATGGTAPLTWSLIGTLPNGLTLDANTGVISGTCTAPVTDHYFTVQVEDAGFPQQTATQDLSITMLPTGGGVPLAITPPSPPTGTETVPYSYTMTATGGVPPYHWSLAGGSGPFPGGLTINSSTGEIAGTPTMSGTFGVTVAVSDSGSPPQVETVAFSITINPTGPYFNLQPNDVVGGQPFNVTVTIIDTDGTPLPGVTVTLGLGLNDSGGTLAGGVATVTNLNGVASFLSVSIDRGGVYTLVAGSGTEPPLFPLAESVQFEVEGFYPIELATMSEPRADLTATRLQAGDYRVLIAGGRGGYGPWPSNLSADWFDPVINWLFALPGMNAPRAGHTATLLDNGRVLVVGGTEQPQTAEIYDPSTTLFTLISAPADTRENHTATLLDDGTVLITGGASTSMPPSMPGATNHRAEIFDPTANGGAGGFVWVTNTMNSPRMWHTATKLQDGRVLIVGGRKTLAGDLVTNSAEIYDPATGNFVPTHGLMSVPRERHTATLLPNGMVLITGGNDYSGTYPPAVHATAEIYNPTYDTFFPAGSMSLPRNHHSATLLGDGSAVLIAGGSGDNAEIFELGGGGFRSTGQMVAVRDDHAAVLLPDPGDDGILGTSDDGPGRVLLVGGIGTGPGPGGEEDTVEIFHAVKW